MDTMPRTLRFCCQKVLPLVYDDSLSYYEVICKLIDFCNKLLANQVDIENILKEYGLTIEQLRKDVDYLLIEFEKVKNGDYVSLYLDSIINWIDKNLQELVGRVVTYIVFGLTSDGYFAAYIPEKWNFIQFDTIVDPNNELYGHLVLRW